MIGEPRTVQCTRCDRLVEDGIAVLHGTTRVGVQSIPYAICAHCITQYVGMDPAAQQRCQVEIGTKLGVQLLTAAAEKEAAGSMADRRPPLTGSCTRCGGGDIVMQGVLHDDVPFKLCASCHAHCIKLTEKQMADFSAALWQKAAMHHSGMWGAGIGLGPAPP